MCDSYYECFFNYATSSVIGLPLAVDDMLNKLNVTKEKEKLERETERER